MSGIGAINKKRNPPKSTLRRIFALNVFCFPDEDRVITLRRCSNCSLSGCEPISADRFKIPKIDIHSDGSIQQLDRQHDAELTLTPKKKAF